MMDKKVSTYYIISLLVVLSMLASCKDRIEPSHKFDCGTKIHNEAGRLMHQVICDSVHGRIFRFNTYGSGKMEIFSDYYEIGVRDLNYNLADPCEDGELGYKANYRGSEFFAFKRENLCLPEGNSLSKEEFTGNCILELELKETDSVHFGQYFIAYPDGFVDSIVVSRRCYHCANDEFRFPMKIESKLVSFSFDAAITKLWEIKADIYLRTDLSPHSFTRMVKL